MLTDCVPTIRWLLDHQLTGGGWLYQEAHPKSGPEPLSIACTIAALCEFERRAALTGECRDLLDPIDHAVAGAWDALMSLKGDSNWRFEHAHFETELSDTASVTIWLIKALNSGVLESTRPAARMQVLRMVRWLFNQSLINGLPSHVGGKLPSLPSTVGVALMYENLRSEDREIDLRAKAAHLQGCVLNLVAVRQEQSVMTTWDWCELGELGQRLCPAVFVPPHGLLEQASECRAAALSGTLTKDRLRKGAIPRQAHGPILYALSRGQPASVPSSWAKARFDNSPEWIRWTVLAVASASVGYYLQYALQQLRWPF